MSRITVNLRKYILSAIICFDLVKYHNYVESFLSLPYEEQVSKQNELLILLFLRLKDNDYYKHFLKNNDLSDFPVITKNEIWLNRLKIKNGIGLTEIHTSGSSGVKGVTYLDHKELMINRAIQLLWWEWAGYKMGYKTIQFGVGVKRKFVKKVKDYLLNVHYVKAFGQSDIDLLRALERYRNKKVNFLGGYASSLFLMAETVDKYNLNMKFNGSISWGDKLFDHYKHKIEAVFKTKVFNTYGSSEGFNIAAECSFGRMHVMMHHVKLEVVDELGEIVPNGVIGHGVVTRLDSVSFPFVRYKMGDLLQLGTGKKECECGRNTDYIEIIVGRDTDIIHFEGGVLTVQIAVYFLKQFEEIDSWQIEYEDFKFIKIKIITKNKYLNLAGIQSIFNDYTKSKIFVIVKIVEKLIVGGVGKPLLFIRQH